ncbi:uncharacterized protein [Arachis hypogaea]|uniref:uncharacterized protein n=1 Tax=Arachis hypogaea TaxID=3818 RepID=UPI0007AF0D93|nr:uncharacterized protein LOC112728145 [Arachis hypogaea]XP_025633961.1 uncharacterized protein LOC112728145 [Arachis hypogaea]QHO24996.1 Putative sugar kinase slr0537 family [Arachis hypogaea]
MHRSFSRHLWLVLRYAILNLKVIQATISLAKQEGLLVSLDLASFEMVRKFKPPLMKLLESGNIDLCFANQDEATELLRDEHNADPVAALEFLAKYCKRAVVTLGHKECIAKHGKEVKFMVSTNWRPYLATRRNNFHGSPKHNTSLFR